MRKQQSENWRARSAQVVLNSCGLVAPLVAGFFTIPILLGHLGGEKFGLLTLFWVLIGYANIFEFGLGRSVTRMLSTQICDISRQTRIISTALILSVLLGIIGMFSVWFGLPRFFEYFAEFPAGILDQAIHGTYYVALALPMLIMSPVLLGVLEAHHRFGLISLIRILTGVLLFAVPAIVVTSDQSVAVLVQSMLFVRVASVLVQLATVALVIPMQRSNFAFSRHDAVQMLSYGGWLTVSAIIGPLLVYADRFVLAAYQTLEEMAIYTTSFEAVVRFLVIPAAIVGVFFPRFVAQHLVSADTMRSLYKEANLIVFVAVIPIPIAMWLFGEPIFAIWLQQGNVDQMAFIGVILSVALLINALAHVPQGYLQATGRADWTGKLHLAELVLWSTYISTMIAEFGAEGAAYSWLLRVTISSVALYFMAAYVMWNKPLR